MKFALGERELLTMFKLLKGMVPNYLTFFIPDLFCKFRNCTSLS